MHSTNQGVGCGNVIGLLEHWRSLSFIKINNNNNNDTEESLIHFESQTPVLFDKGKKKKKSIMIMILKITSEKITGEELGIENGWRKVLGP